MHQAASGGGLGIVHTSVDSSRAGDVRKGRAKDRTWDIVALQTCGGERPLLPEEVRQSAREKIKTWVNSH